MLRRTDAGTTHWVGDDGYAGCWHEHRGCAEERVERLEAALLGLRLGDDCWCEVAIGNPMVREHTATCHAARRALTNLGK